MSTAYCNIKMINGKKVPDFGATWGSMNKEDANASFIQTGNDLYVIDADFKDVTSAPKKIKKFIKKLGEPTVETARGYHWYIKSDVPMQNHQNIFGNKEYGIDIRGDGGLVFTRYWGPEEGISYKRVGKVIRDKKFKIWRALPKSITEPKPSKPAQERGDVGQAAKEDVKRALSRVDIMDYQDRDNWMRIIAAIYHGLGDKGEKLARKWSQGDPENYDEAAFSNIWRQVTEGRYGTDISVGTLFDASRDQSPEELFPIDKSFVDPDKPKKKADKKGKFTIMETPGKLTDEAIRKRKSQTVLFKGILVKGMHTFLFGTAGSNKTTVAAWLGVEVLKTNEDMLLHFWSFDAAQNHEKAIFDYVKENGVGNRFHIVSGQTTDVFHDYYKKAIEDNADLSELVIVIDTFKFITTDVNSKNANKKAMHYIKELQALGATVLSLGHTNKDGMNQSGTAEIEQDSDGLLRIDRRFVPGQDGAADKEVTLSIAKAGRVRFESEGITITSTPKMGGYRYLKSALDSMKLSDGYVDLASNAIAEEKHNAAQETAIAKKRVNMVKDQDAIITIVAYLEQKGSITRTELVETLKEIEGFNHKKSERILNDYSKTFWDWSMEPQEGRGRPVKIYKLTDDYKSEVTTLEHIVHITPV